MNKALPAIHESVSELEDRLRAEVNPKRKERLQLLLLLQDQRARSRQAAARLLGRSRNTVGRWLSIYEQEGLQALLAVYQPAGQSGQRTLPEEAFQALGTLLDQPEGFGGYMHLVGWLRAEYDLEVNYETLRKIVRTHFEAKLKVPRPVHEKKTPSAPPPSPAN